MESRERIYYRNTSANLATQLKNYRVAMSRLHKSEETEQWQNPSARIADDPEIQRIEGDEQEFVEDYDGEDENRDENLGPVPPDVFYSTQDMQELHQEWQETHRQEMVELQRNMQSQLDAQAARARAQQNLGTTAQNSAEGEVPIGQPRLSMSAPVFVPGQALGMGMTFYNSTP